MSNLYNLLIHGTVLLAFINENPPLSAIASSSPFFAVLADEAQVLSTNSVAENTDEAGLMPIDGIYC